MTRRGWTTRATASPRGQSSSTTSSTGRRLHQRPSSASMTSWAAETPFDGVQTRT